MIIEIDKSFIFAISFVILLVILITLIGWSINRSNQTEEKIDQCYKLDLKNCIDCCYDNRTMSYDLTDNDCKLNCFINNEINKLEEI